MKEKIVLDPQCGIPRPPSDVKGTAVLTIPFCSTQFLSITWYYSIHSQDMSTHYLRVTLYWKMSHLFLISWFRPGPWSFPFPTLTSVPFLLLHHFFTEINFFLKKTENAEFNNNEKTLFVRPIFTEKNWVDWLHSFLLSLNKELNPINEITGIDLDCLV